MSVIAGITSNDHLPQNAELVIVGGGLAGVTTAYYAAKLGVDVLLIEKGEIGSEQSSRAWGYVRQQERDPAELALMMSSNEIWQSLEAELDADLEWQMSGNLGIARTAAQLEAYRGWHEIGKAAGLETVLLEAGDIAEFLPGLRGKWLGGLMTPSDGHASPPKTTAAFSAAAARLGAVIHTHCAVTDIIVKNNRIQGVRTEHGHVATDKVVCAAGAWSARLLKALGIRIPQLRVRASVGLTGPTKPLVTIASWSPEIAFRQRPDGVVVVARFDHADHDLTLNSLLEARRFFPTLQSSSEKLSLHLGLPSLRDLADRCVPAALTPNSARRWAVGLPRTNFRSPAHALDELKKLFDDAKHLRIEDCWSCYMDITPDMLPVLGGVAGCDGLTIATGLSGHGFAMAPIIGTVTADNALARTAQFDLSAFSAERWHAA